MEAENESVIDDFNLSDDKKRKVWGVILTICLIIAVCMMVFYSFRAGAIYACEKSGAQLMIDPEFRCFFEEEIITQQMMWKALFNTSGVENG